MNTGNSDLFDKKMDINIKPFHRISLIVLTFLSYMFQERLLPPMDTDNGNDSSKILIHPANPLNDLQRRLLNPLENYPSNSLKMKYSKFPFSVFTKLQFGEQHSG